MKIHLLIFSNPDFIGSDSLKSLDAFEESAGRLGHELVPIFYRDCLLKFDKKPSLLMKGCKKRDIKVLLVRANFRKDECGNKSAIIKQFEMEKIPVVNKSLAVSWAKNKFKTMQVLSRHGVPIPKTYVVNRNYKSLDDIAMDIGSFPVIIKTVAGSKGSGVSIIESKRGLRSIIPLIMKEGNSNAMIVQEYVKEARGRDIRVFIVGKKIIAAMERIAAHRNEFRSNFHLGGKVRLASLSKEEKRVALKAARVMGLEMAGVDILRTNDGPKVLEVNANPGIEGITKATGKDIAGYVIKYAVKKYEEAKRERKEKRSGKKHQKDK